MVLWGIENLIDVEGFVGGIGNQLDAIGMIVSYVIKVALVQELFGF